MNNFLQILFTNDGGSEKFIFVNKLFNNAWKNYQINYT